MRKRIPAVVAVGAAAVLMLSGFDSAMTKEQLVENSMSAMGQVSSMSATMHGEAAANVHVSQEGENGMTMDVPITGNLDLSLNMNMEPLQVGMVFDYNMEAMGQGGNGGMQLYLIENEDGTGSLYSEQTDTTGESQWSAETADAETFAQVKEAFQAALSGDFSAISSMNANGSAVDLGAVTGMIENYRQQFTDMMQLSPESVSVNGKECYELTSDVTGDSLMDMYTDLMGASGQTADSNTYQAMAPIVEGIVMHAESRFDVNTCLPVDAVIDMGGSDFSSFGNAMAGAMTGGNVSMDASLDVSALGMNASFEFDQPVTVTVPQEGLDAAAGGSGDIDADPEDLIGGLLSGGTGTDGSDLDLGTDDEGPVQNADGTYSIQYEDYNGTAYTANVAVPDGLHLGYGNVNYLGFSDDAFTIDVDYLVAYQDTPQEAVADELNTTYFESDSSYSDIYVTDVMQTTLADGNVVYYGTLLYTYNGFRLGETACALQAGDAVVRFEIQKDDENNDRMEATEQDVQTYASYVTPAA